MAAPTERTQTRSSPAKARCLCPVSLPLPDGGPETPRPAGGRDHGSPGKSCKSKCILPQNRPQTVHPGPSASPAALPGPLLPPLLLTQPQAVPSFTPTATEQLINNQAINQTDTQPLPLETFLLSGCNQILNAGELTTAGREKSPGGRKLEPLAFITRQQVSSAPLSPSPPLPDGKPSFHVGTAAVVARGSPSCHSCPAIPCPSPDPGANLPSCDLRGSASVAASAGPS